MNNNPAVVSTDYMKLFAEQIRGFVPAENYRVLGTMVSDAVIAVKIYVITLKSMLLMLSLQH